MGLSHTIHGCEVTLPRLSGSIGNQTASALVPPPTIPSARSKHRSAVVCTRFRYMHAILTKYSGLRCNSCRSGHTIFRVRFSVRNTMRVVSAGRALRLGAQATYDAAANLVDEENTMKQAIECAIMRRSPSLPLHLCGFARHQQLCPVASLSFGRPQQNDEIAARHHHSCSGGPVAAMHPVWSH